MAGCGGTNWSSRATPPTTVQSAKTADAASKPKPKPTSEATNAKPTAPTPSKSVAPSTAKTTPSTAPRSTTGATTPASTPTTTSTGGSVGVSGVETGETPIGNATEWVEYDDPSGVSLVHPRAWTIRSSSAGPVVVSIDGSRTDAAGFRRTVNLLQQPLADGLTASDYLRYTLGQISETGGVVEQNRATTLGGVAGRELVWHATEGGVTHRFLSVWAVRAHLAFLVTYSSDSSGFAKPLPDVRRLVSSIRLPPS